jgi:hypothetical protein
MLSHVTSRVGALASTGCVDRLERLRHLPGSVSDGHVSVVLYV